VHAVNIIIPFDIWREYREKLNLAGGAITISIENMEIKRGDSSHGIKGRL